MQNIYYQDYRIEIRPTRILGGWGAKVHIWSFESGTTRMTPLAVPVHIPFATEASVCAYAEKVGRQWVEQRSTGREERAATATRAPAGEEQRQATFPGRR
jgi:hypothetical protein